MIKERIYLGRISSSNSLSKKEVLEFWGGGLGGALMTQGKIAPPPGDRFSWGIL